MANLKSILKGGFPFISTGLDMAGPLGGVAKNVLGAALGVDKPNPSADDLDTAFSKIPADQLGPMIERMKAAEQQFQLDAQKLGFQDAESLAKIAADDRDSARRREEIVHDNTPRNLAYIYAAGFFLTLAAEICIAIWVKDINQLVMKSIDVLLGAELGMVLGSKEYYFGSSRGQDENLKNSALQK